MNASFSGPYSAFTDHYYAELARLGYRRDLAWEAKVTEFAGVKRIFPPRYRDPVTFATWSGRGTRPAWCVGDLARYEIPYDERCVVYFDHD